jgi:hypothetical protein
MPLMKPISFIELIDMEDKIAADRYKTFATLVKQYSDQIAIERVSNFTSMDGWVEAEEVTYYTCMIFYKHWVEAGLDTIVDPH